jgi:DNA polymerase-4/DNA polymerase V
MITELVRKDLTTSFISVFLRLKSFESVGRNVRITATNDYSRINHIVKAIFNHVFRDGIEYRACGVIASSLQPDVQQGNLFAAPLQTGKQLALTKVMDEINTRFGNQVLRPANSLKRKAPKVRFKYPLLSAS